MKAPATIVRKSDILPHRDGKTPMDRLRDVVLVYERPSAIEPLARMLIQLNCQPLDAGIAGAAARAIAPRAAIVSDAIDDPIAVCAALPADVPKILIASDASFAFRSAAARAGVDALLKRPVDVNALSDWLAHFDKDRVADPISVLLVDDDDLTASIHAAVLRSAGITVTVVTRQDQVLDVLEATAPDLVLMDVQMPGIDGIELARIIRQSRENLSIPIAFLSAESNEGRQMLARRFGGDDFISKPVDLTRLVSLVRLRAERARDMRALIERDSLTGLLNHGRFQQRVSMELERGRRTGAAISLAMLDLDHFKTINDKFGHPAGDRVIRTLARTLMGRLRETDVIGRYGGEEFGVLLLDTEPEFAARVINEVRRVFGEIVFDDPAGRFSVSFSAGVAGGNGGTIPQIFGAADMALYAAKRLGRNMVEIARRRKIE